MSLGSVKTNRYVMTGEVDPGVAAMAKRIAWQSKADYKGPGVAIGHVDLEVGPVSDFDAWLFASRWGGYDVQIVDAMSLGSVNLNGDWMPGQVAVFVASLKKNWGANREALQTFLPESPEAVEALLFYQGDDLEFPSRLHDDPGITHDMILELAKSVASSVPPLGKQWIVSFLVKGGATEPEAIVHAESVYAAGSNLSQFIAIAARQDAITAILRERDPGVTEEQIARVVASPMSVAEVHDKILGGPPSEGGGLALPATLGVGAGLAAAFVYGGPVGWAVGAGVALATYWWRSR